MDKYMNSGIKEVISEFPVIGKILNDFGIGCVTCSVGTCLLKDIITVHGLNKEQEKAVMSRMEKVIYPERNIEITEISDLNSEAETKAFKYSPPVKMLVNEHDNIKRLLKLIPEICEGIRKTNIIDKQLIEDSVYFIRNYADKFHHAKEEDILFKLTDESQDIIKVMYEDHKTGRDYVKAIMDGVQNNDPDAVVIYLLNYRELLTGHIKKEDEILYPWFDRNLSTRQIGELSNAFYNVDNGLGSKITEEFEAFLKKTETIFNF